MRGSIWTVVAVGVGAAMTPLVLDVDVSSGGVGETALTLLSPFGVLLGLAFVIAAFGLLTMFFTRDTF